MTFHRLVDWIIAFFEFFCNNCAYIPIRICNFLIILLNLVSLTILHECVARKSLVLAGKQELTHANQKCGCSDMVNTRRKNQGVRGASANAGGAPGEQPSANGPSPRQQQEEAGPTGPAMSE